MKKLLYALLSIVLCGPLPVCAMAPVPPDTIDRAVYTFNLPALQRFIGESNFDPNMTPITQGFECWDPDAKYCFLLDYAIDVCQRGEITQGREALIEYLIPLTTNDKAFIKALTRVLSRHNRAEELVGIEQLLLQEAARRNLNIEKASTKALFYAAGCCNVASARNLLTLGANRAARSNGKTIFEYVTERRENAIWQEAKEEERRMEGFLRTYAPDLKNLVALDILNLVREGKLSREVLCEKLHEDALEVIQTLVCFDKDVERKWIALGMPYLEKAEMRLIKSVEQTPEIVEAKPKRAQIVNL